MPSKDLLKGLAIGLIVSGLLLAALGLLLADWARGQDEAHRLLSLVTRGPQYSGLLLRLHDAAQQGQGLSLSPEEVQSLYPLLSSLKTSVSILDTSTPKGFAGTMTLLGIILAGVGAGLVLRPALAKKGGGKTSPASS